MEQPIVSVIMPVYNGHDHLRQCLDSVIRQTLKDIEIICVDDGSTDDSAEILKEYAAKDPRVRVILQENGGAGAARNNGLRHAKGRYLSFLDSDDFFEKTMLKKAVDKIQEDQAEFVVFRCDQYLNDTGEYKKIHYSLKNECLPPYKPFPVWAIVDNVFRVFVGWAWDKLYDAEFVRKYGFTFQEQRTSNDLLFVFSALVKAQRITYLDEILAHQRRNNNESLSNTREKSWFCFYDALCALRDYLKSQNIYEDLEQDFINYALHFSLWNLNTITGDGFTRLYNKLKTEWFADLGITAHDRSYFRDEKEYLQYAEIMDRECEDYPIKISTVIPVHNAEKYIGKCLDSILLDQKIGTEVICVDDCSTDSTPQILKEYAEKYDNVHVLTNETNLYAGLSRNRGLAAARGYYVHFLDSDDYVVKGAYEKLYAKAVSSNLDWIKTTAEAFDDSTGETVPNHRYVMRDLDPGYFDTLLDFHHSPRKFLAYISLVPWNAIYKRSFLLEKKLQFNDLFCVNDRSFYVDSCVKGSRMMATKEKLVMHRANVSGSLVAKRVEHFDCQFNSFRIMKKICDDNAVSDMVRFRILDAELRDIMIWYRSAIEKSVLTEKLKQDMQDFLKEEVNIPWFERRGKDCEWLNYRHLLDEPASGTGEAASEQ